jgi:acetylornithine deacetylase/succinyl-diaminopimelate desuccinylase-like protein
MKRSVLPCLAVLIFGLVIPAPAAPGGAKIGRPGAYFEKNRAAIIKEFSDLLAIPNQASDGPNIRRNAAAIVTLLERRGVAAETLEDGEAPPLVYGEVKAPGAAKTIVFYAHYDGQPVDRSQWKTDPWRAVEKDGRIYARSASDDKAPIIALAAALDFLRAEKRPLSVNVKFLFEGEEEAGSPHLAALLRKHRNRLAADAVFICDGPVDQSGRSQIIFGARGTLGLEITVFGPNHPLHSGHYGNWAPNPIALLTNLLATMRDEDGNILIEGFGKGVRAVTEEEKSAIREFPSNDARLRAEYGLAWTEAGNAPLAERILIPALNFRGLKAGGVGGQAPNAVPSEARASIDFRLVPDQAPETVKRLVEEHIRKKGFRILRTAPDVAERLRGPRPVLIEWEEGYPPYRLPLDHPLGRAVLDVAGRALGAPPLRLPSVGGSVPMKMFADALGAPVLGLPIANYDNNQHGPDENLRLENLRDGIVLFAGILADLGHAWK